MRFIEQYLLKNFMKLPLWARVISYFVVLGLFVYLALAPRFVNGDVVAEKNGAVRPYRGVEIKTSVEGRTLKFRTNEEGVWSIPLISRFPADVRVAVKHVDSDEWLEVVLSRADIWGGWSPTFRITIDESPPKATVRVVDANRFETLVDRALVAMVTGAVYAGELVLPSNMQTIRDDPTLKKTVDESVYRAIATSHGRPTSGPIKDLPLIGAGAPSYVDRIDIIRTLEDQFKILIPDEHWQSMSSSRELAEYIYRRKLLERSNPSRYQIKQSYDWTKIENTAPSDERPKFRTLQK